MIGALEAVGYLIVAGAAGQAAVGLADGWRRSRQERRIAEADARLFERQAELLLSRAAAERDRVVNTWNGYRKFSVARKIREAEGITSFELTPHDGRRLAPFLPGQYLTFQVRPPGQGKPVIRCYSLSDGPNRTDRYRVTIKKIAAPDGCGQTDGLVSSWFNDVVKEGDLLDVKAPTGGFHLDPHREVPVVLIAGGIGLTPALSMLNAICTEEGQRETWLFNGVRNRHDHIFAEHLADIRQLYPNIRVITCYSQPTEDCVSGRDYDHAGRVDIRLLKEALPSNNYDFYICGPAAMMEQITQDLRDWGVPAGTIHFEAFGPATVKRHPPAEESPQPAAAIEVQFGRSNKKVAWHTGSLLDLAEANGVSIDSGCRAGNCGTCVVAIREGEVDYLSKPGEPPEKGTCLACVAVPASRLVLDI
ncbi:MAG: 2Fe-2S iron-sulfur cluster binding domain-containing protein [Azospirillum sp.]|nr:2Fe-2S iron-sulfur cluster binding domain-containing protein [Azospirillum sp.]